MKQTTVTGQVLAGALADLATEHAPDALELIRDTRDQLESIERQHVETMRANGYSWAEIGDALGVTRAAAWQRFAPRER